MSLAFGFKWTHEDISLTGFSIAGVTTSVAFPAADVCFDLGQGLPFQNSISNIAITHGHLDHAAGLPYLLGQKAMHSAKPPHVYVPKSLVAPLSQIIEIWAKIEDHTYQYNLEGLGEADVRSLKGKYYLKPFRTFHRIDSQGYTVFMKKKRLRAEFQGLSSNELGLARLAGKRLDEEFDQPVLSFTGDTKIEAMESAQVRQSRVIVFECTYWDDRRGVQKAREWGHTHIDEVIPWLDRLECEKLLLIHSSARYKRLEIEEILNRKIPFAHRHRVELFPRD